MLGPPPDWVDPDSLFYECSGHVCIQTEGIPYLLKLKQYTDEMYACVLNTLGD